MIVVAEPGDIGPAGALVRGIGWNAGCFGVPLGRVVAMFDDPGGDAANGFDHRQRLDDRLVQRALIGAGQPGSLRQLAQDLDAFDRVDAEVGLQVEFGVQHVHRVAGSVGHDRRHQRLQRGGAQHRWSGVVARRLALVAPMLDTLVVGGVCLGGAMPGRQRGGG